jgi:hypothetical protein
MTKHKITPRDLDEKGGVERLEAMGHNRHTIHDAMFKITNGISNNDRTKLMQNLYKRSLESRYGKPPTRWI